MSRTVMIVDDSLFMRKILRGFLVEKGYIVTAEAASGKSFYDLVRERVLDPADAVAVKLVGHGPDELCAGDDMG